MPASRSPDGRHEVRVAGGVVYLDGRRVHPTEGAVYLVTAPVWRSDGCALAWIERGDGATRLVVVPDVATYERPITWELPNAGERELVSWAGANRVVVGPEMLRPVAVASWD